MELKTVKPPLDFGYQYLNILCGCFRNLMNELTQGQIKYFIIIRYKPININVELVLKTYRQRYNYNNCTNNL